MKNSTLVPVSGVIQNITPFQDDCCTIRIFMRTSDGPVNFMITPSTYVIQESKLRIGMSVTAFYDSSLPIPLIYPPQYQAVIIGRQNPREFMYAGYFNRQLIAEDNSLQLNISRTTEIVTSNGQTANCNLGNHLLIVFYSSTTRSVPPQTTPHKIIVLC